MSEPHLWGSRWGMSVLGFPSTTKRERKQEEQSEAQKITELMKRQKEENRGGGKKEKIDILKDHRKQVYFLLSDIKS